MSDFNDTFSGETTGTDLTAHTPDVGTGWARHTSFSTVNVLINSSGYTYSQFGNGTIYYLTDSLSNADYTVRSSCYSASTSCAGPAGRISSSAETFYLVFYEHNNAEWRLYKAVAGSYTLLSQYAGDAPSTQRVVDIIFSGTSLKVDVDSVNRISTTDSSISAAGHGGGYWLDASEQLSAWSLTYAASGGTNYDRTLNDQTDVQDKQQIIEEMYRQLLSELTLTDNGLIFAELLRIAVSNVELGDTVLIEALYNRVLPEAVDIVDAIARVITGPAIERILSSSVEITDTVSWEASYSRLLASLLDTTDNVSVTAEHNRILASVALDIVDSMPVSASLYRLMASNISLLDSLIRTIVLAPQVYERLLREGIALNDDLIRSFVLAQLISHIVAELQLRAVDVSIVSDTLITNAISADQTEVVDIITESAIEYDVSLANINIDISRLH